MDHISTTIAPESEYDTASGLFKSHFKKGLTKLIQDGHAKKTNSARVKLTQGIKKKIREGDLQPGHIFRKTKKQTSAFSAEASESSC